MLKIIQIIFFFVLLFGDQILPQSFGFGCFGFVGGFGGFCYQQYQADGLNRSVSDFNLINSKYIENEMSKFGKATGYRVGINIFRARFTGFFLTVKGFYQQLHEERNGSVISTAIAFNDIRDIKLKSWGLGLDLGIPITSYFNWKIIDGIVLINTSRFTQTINSSEGTLINKLRSEKAKIGYSVGTGFIFEIVKDYISIEGVTSYTQFSIDKLIVENVSGNLEIENQNDGIDKFIDSGGFSAVVQLNLGFPL